MSENTQAPAQRAADYNPIKIDLDAVKAVVGTEEAAADWPETLWFPTSEDDPGRGATTAAIDAEATLPTSSSRFGGPAPA